MHGLAEAFVIMGAVPLGNHHRRAGGQACAEAHDGIDNRSRGADRRLGFLPDELAHHQGIHRIVQLLEEQSDGHGNRELQHMLPDISLGHIQIQPGHRIPSSLSCGHPL